MLESVTHAILTLDAGWRVTYANREAARLNGTTPDALIGRDHWVLWPEALGSEVERRYRRVADEQVAEHFVHHYPLADAWHEIHAYPSGDGGVAILYRDISAERHASVERDRLATELQQRERELATLLEHATDVVVRLDARGACSTPTRRCARRPGARRSAWWGAGWPSSRCRPASR
jgi:PAS domain S-box-containing protein